MVFVDDACARSMSCFFFFNDTATTEIYTLSLHDALPIFAFCPPRHAEPGARSTPPATTSASSRLSSSARRSEEHTSELQSRQYLVCRLLLEKKKNAKRPDASSLRQIDPLVDSHLTVHPHV